MNEPIAEENKRVHSVVMSPLHVHQLFALRFQLGFMLAIIP